MGTVRTTAGQTVMTHYFSTQYEARNYAADAGTGWYYQLGADPKAKMHGPFQRLDELMKVFDP